ncbi:tetratricopeptide repeat protein [Beggiatoa leptomitoformis]|uniref:Sel1 repeat family protein n=1 Tax=Beggiatoa leptomitoformis TaxID=288004 RepID=A0A2N9YGD7_9GAMM|nr:tetratricopeptide repeat protein [Beggiatoa leptomitoformis]ALG68139.1 hypothetical protein AL038_10995 [Beggiatoa leptomitoformis]AUI69564.1 hypothetical protein BLE401_13265 [Beggiatoa leptomitoformis]
MKLPRFLCRFLTTQPNQQSYQQVLQEQRQAEKYCKQGFSYLEGEETGYIATKEAIDCFKQASRYNNVEALLALGRLYTQGVAGNGETAFYWYGRAYQLGSAEASYHIGLCYLGGEGVDVNYKKAATYFREAAEQGYADAQYQLGMMCNRPYGLSHDNYTYAIGVLHDKDSAYYWLERAAQQAHKQAQLALGMWHEREAKHGEHYFNYTKASYWYTQAISNGCHTAELQLKYLQQQLAKQKGNSVNITKPVVINEEFINC